MAWHGGARFGLARAVISGLPIYRVGFPVQTAPQGAAGRGMAGRGKAWQDKGRKAKQRRMTMLNTITVKITGMRPLLMHSDKFANPLDPLTKAHKELTGKRKKTDEDHEAIARSEWMGGLYIDEQGPYLPGVNIESCLVAGGKLSKLGTQLKRSVEVMDEKCHLIYDGPKEPEALWEAGFYDARSVKVQTARLMRYRPLFRQWACECEIAYDPDSINREQVIKCLEDGGQYCGVGDYRPKFGRFSVEVIS